MPDNIHLHTPRDMYTYVQQHCGDQILVEYLYLLPMKLTPLKNNYSENMNLVVKKWSWKSWCSNVDSFSYSVFEISIKANISSIAFTLSWSFLDELYKFILDGFNIDKNFSLCLSLHLFNTWTLIVFAVSLGKGSFTIVLYEKNFPKWELHSFQYFLHIFECQWI